jgi:WD repeat-containing protein 48
MAPISRRVSYILPAPTEEPPLLALPPLGQRRRGNTSPNLIYKASTGNFGSRNPFADEPSPATHPRHCLGVTSLALDTSTLLANTSSPGGILYTGGRDGLVASWELGIPHKRRRGGRYEVLPGRGGHKVKWERIGDGAEIYSDDEEDMEEREDSEDMDEDEGYSSEEEVGEGWEGVNGDRMVEGMRKRRAGRGEVPYEDRWEVDREELAQTKVRYHRCAS